jgi:tight adherence protein B
MLVATVVFIVVAALVVGGYAVISSLPGARGRRPHERPRREGGDTRPGPQETLGMRHAEGPLPAVDRFIGQTGAGSSLAKLIEQAGATVAPSTVIVMSVVVGFCAAVATQILVRIPLALVLTVPLGTASPVLWLMHRRSSRLKRFEEQFPEALDLISRAIRAGHAFQTALGMVADELTPPVGPEFKKTFDQQNFGLPVRDALNALAERVPLVDVKFFITAVAIQRDTGGNLAEVLDSLAHVVRERFKIQRQVRVHTAHGRITGFVLLTLPAFLAVALSLLNPEHMKPLFQERMGQTMLTATIMMEIVGFIWIRRVIKIEV